MADGEARRVAFFGGSFDPPHLGHLAVARAARQALRLDLVLFAPVGVQPLKPGGSSASFENRLRMTELAVADEPGFEVSEIDAPDPSGQPNYTLETLLRIRTGLPAGSQLFFLMGADSFLTLSRWHRAAEIPFAAALVVASRPGQSLKDLQPSLPHGFTIEDGETLSMSGASPAIALCSYTVRNSSGESAQFYVLPGLDVEISASEIREQIRAGAELATARPLLPPAVTRYIREHGLYR
jgi:nicotinate-nucleotide adenylyltransferase